MADFSNENVLDLEIIKSFFDSESNFDEEFDIIVEDIVGVGHEEKTYSCKTCGKGYKTNGGLKRHEKIKHNIVAVSSSSMQQQKTQNIFTIDSTHFKDIVVKAVEKLGADDCFPDYQNEFQMFSITTEENLEVWELFQPVISTYKGNAEKFYSDAFGLFQPGKQQVFKKLSFQLSALLCSEITNLCLVDLSCNNSSDFSNIISKESTPILTEKDIHCIQYLAGYCYRTVFQRIRRKKQWQSEYSQQCLTVLKAAKLATPEGQPLIMSRDRGGLWCVCEKAIEIFKVCEKEFVIATHNSNHNIDCEKIVSKLLLNCHVKSNFEDICLHADCSINNEVSKNLLQTLILLYLRVRSHSYAKQVREQHKLAIKKTASKKSLRKSIKQASNNSDRYNMT